LSTLVSSALKIKPVKKTPASREIFYGFTKHFIGNDEMSYLRSTAVITLDSNEK
jgi:hypothetical protein